MFCNNCGAKLEDGAKFCTVCGNPVAQEKTTLTSSEVTQKILSADKKKVFRADKNSGMINLGIMIAMAFAAILWFYKYSELPRYFYEEERRVFFFLGILCAALALENLLIWFARSKVKLCIGEESVSGVSTKVFFSREFEYEYSEISEVASILGTLQIRANGKWVVIPGIENRKLAKKMIEERLSEK